jgi:hypothetical protein
VRFGQVVRFCTVVLQGTPDLEPQALEVLAIVQRLRQYRQSLLDRFQLLIPRQPAPA